MKMNKRPRHQCGMCGETFISKKECFYHMDFECQKLITAKKSESPVKEKPVKNHGISFE